MTLLFLVQLSCLSTSGFTENMVELAIRFTYYYYFDSGRAKLDLI